MMYKLILVASAVNADLDDHPNTAQLLSMACSMVTLLPGTVSAAAETTANTYSPIHFSPGDLEAVDTLAATACKSLKEGQTFQEAAKDQLLSLKSDVFPGVVGSVAGKATTYFMGEKSKVAGLTKALLQEFVATQSFGKNKVDIALKFVTFIDSVDDDKNTHMGYGDVLPKDEAAKMKKLVKEVKKSLEDAKESGETELTCGSDVYKKLQELVKNGVYDELISKVSTEKGTVQDIGTNLIARVAVSKAVSFTDCKTGRILLA